MERDRQDNQLQLNKMGTMPIGKLLISMSLPAMFSMMIQALYNIVDSVFVGFIGESALTAVTLIFPIQMLIISVAVGTGIGINSLISRRLGQGNKEDANVAANHGIFLGIVNWVIFAAFGLFFSGVFVSSFSESASMTADATIYCQIVTIGSIFIFIQINVEKTLQATGNMIFPMMCTLVGAITNIILDPILIFGLLGAPKLGVAGAAIATVIGQSLAMLLGLILLFAGKHEVHVSLSKFKLSKSAIKNIYAVGLPSIVMQSIASVMVIGLNAILITFSGAAVAVLGAYFRLQSFIFMPVFGLNQGAMPIFGYNYGAKNKERLMTTYKWALVIALIIMSAGLIVFQVFPAQLLNMFSASQDMLEIGVPALRIISTCFLFAGIGIISATIFQATGHGMLSLFISLLRQLILILPITYILAHFFGLKYLWFAFPLAEFFGLLATLGCLRYLYVKDIRDLGTKK